MRPPPNPFTETLDRMADLLSAYGENSWADALRRLSTRVEVEDVRREILRLYGGAGSLNDLVLHATDLTDMRRDNTEFDKLRTELFQLCRPA